MRITQWGEYGILCLLFLDDKTSKGCKSVTAHEISEAQSIDVQYAQQILQRLRKSGILSSSRGSQGGYFLSKSAADITLYDVLNACEGDTFEVICDHKPINKDKCIVDTLCTLKPVWHGLKGHIDKYLKGISIKDLAQVPSRSDDHGQRQGLFLCRFSK